MEGGYRNLILIAAIAFGIIVFFFTWVSFDEWYTVKVIQNADVLITYNFGDADIIQKKGWHYTSADLYAEMNFIQGISLLVIFIITIISAIKRNIWWLLASFLLIVISFFFWKWFLGLDQMPLIIS